MTIKRITIVLWLMFTITACQTAKTVQTDTRTKTLGQINTSSESQSSQKVFIKPKSSEEIRKAYTEYLNNAAQDEGTRLEALKRLAELEYSESGKYASDSESSEALSEEDKRYYQRLEKTILLLSTSINDYPDAEGNDSILYQLAKAQAQNNQHNESIQSLNILVEKYPLSTFYAEAQFRIAEDAFSLQDYSLAEYAYSEVLLTPDNEIFYEKSLFKRGWARFKQQYYDDALEDFFEAVIHHNFTPETLENPSEKEQYEEYFRAIALTFSYKSDPQDIAEYLQSHNEFAYRHKTYAKIAQLYLGQERFSDAVETHRQFIQYFPDSENIPYSYLKIIEIWKDSGFNQQIYQAIEDFYITFNPLSQYWKEENENSAISRDVRDSLRQYIVLMAEYFHNQYQIDKSLANYQQAEIWYERYLQHYGSYAIADNIFFLYAELLAQNEQNKDALGYYQKAAFDNDLILHQEAAYAAIIMSGRLHDLSVEPAYLDQIILYTRRYARRYDQDPRTIPIALYASEQAIRYQRYRDAIILADLINLQPLDQGKQRETNQQISQIKASAYFNLHEYEESESIFIALLENNSLRKKERQELEKNLALSVYKQAELARGNDDIQASIKHYARISSIVPDNDIAATGLFDAIALNMQNQLWSDAITLSQQFQRLYPNNKFSNDVAKKLSTAYLKSDQGIKAAEQFEKIARNDSDLEVQAAALWQAAEIYQSKGKVESAKQTYKEYTSKFPKPHSARLEAMNKIAQLYQQQQEPNSSRDWYKQIIQVDEKALNNAKTDLSREITSGAYLYLARYQKDQFDQIDLTLPLGKSLKEKKRAMQASVKLFGQASINKDFSITTEATYSIGKIYEDFSEALLSSDRPENLSDDELDQYEILLEDQAFPFEDKSIEFFEINMGRIQQGLYNDWIKKSLEALTQLFPVRYKRQPKLDDYVFGMD